MEDFNNIGCDTDSGKNTRLKVIQDEFLGFDKIDVDCTVCKSRFNIEQVNEWKNTRRKEELIAAISLIELQNIKRSDSPIVPLNESVENNVQQQKKNCYHCNHCDYKVNKKHHLEQHLRAHLKPYLCTVCSKVFSSLRTLQRHMEKMHDNHKGKKLFQCCLCDYKTTFVKKLQRHNCVHGKEMFKCLKCSCITLTKASLDRHIRIHDSPKLHECNECGYITTIKDEMNSHMHIHGGKKIFKCELCSFQTSHRGYFVAHKDFHSSYPLKKENPDSKTKFMCSGCSFVTLLRSSLLKHVKCCGHQLSRQTWELLNFCDSGMDKKFHCPYCGYFSFSFEKLKNHAISVHCKE